MLHAAEQTGGRKANNTSLVLRVTNGEKGLALLPADAEMPLIRGLLASECDLGAEVLLLPHHGSRSSLSRELYRQVQPRLAVASCGYLNHFHFPHPEVREALQEKDIPLLTTAQEGSIRVSWQGPELEMEVEVEIEKGMDDTLWGNRKETASRESTR